MKSIQFNLFVRISKFKKKIHSLQIMTYVVLSIARQRNDQLTVNYI